MVIFLFVLFVILGVGFVIVLLFRVVLGFVFGIKLLCKKLFFELIIWYFKNSGMYVGYFLYLLSVLFSLCVLFLNFKMFLICK